jgi:uncharacterized protein YjiS (DUF1127 family)
MTAYTNELMTNHHHDVLTHPVAAITGLLHLWRQRYQRRSELARLSDRDFHDVGKSWSDFAHEASKPFWRA